MAKYRWGFETIEGGTPIFTECYPVVEDSTSLDYAKQTNEVFYRAKLNGNLTFRFDTFDYIINAGYNAVHIIVLQHYVEADSDWSEIWRGKFTLTDCTINYDTHTIEISPETQDRYTAVLDAMEKEYNLVSLLQQQKRITINIRPCLQIYCGGDSKLTNYVGESFWEASCESSIIDNDLQNLYHFAKIGEVFAVYFEMYVPFENPRKVIAYTNNTERDADQLIYLQGSDGITYDCFVFQSGNERRYTVRHPDTNVNMFTATYIDYELQGIEENPTLLTPPNAMVQWSAIYSRVLLQTEEAQIAFEDTICTTYDIPSNDIAGMVNLNYNKVAPIPTACAHFMSSTEVSDEPTEWGQSYTDQYFVRPSVAGYHIMPVAPAQWKYASLWFYPYYRYSLNIDNYSASRTIRDGYDLRQTIAKLMSKAGVTLQGVISGCLGGSQDYVGSRTLLVITPKSNVISSYYDSPAQNAPISLAKIFNMLKAVYQCYWYIDNNGYLHIEHISFFDNGYSYSEDAPNLLVDLESELHTRTSNNKVYGQNTIKYEKAEMPERFSFGWADKQTKAFDGFPINCLDNYVQKGNISEQNAADYDSDVDFVLSSPNDVSKEGFFLFALPLDSGNYSNTLKIEKVRITDDSGDTYDVTIQNADAAFVKIHKTWWRYHLPCENINVNNEDTVALTTGSYKLQSVEFADMSVNDIISNVDDCIRLIRTQQGDGHIKTISINLNSYAAKADLLFNFVGRWYYLRGTALGASITINVNGESVTIDVNNNSYIYRYREPISALDFAGTDVVSVNFADCDNFNNLTSADSMFEDCAELIAVDFGGKAFGAVTTAADMFKGCTELTTLICPSTESWKADLDFTDCPNLTLDSLNDLINEFLYAYETGTHTITPNATMWNALEGAVQDDIIARALAKGWTISIPAQYSLRGTSASSVVYATINGNAIEIDVVGGNWSYDYNTPITSISFASDANVQTIDFSLTDGLANVTSLDNAFKDCTMLTSVDFTNCDLTNVVSASDCFANCSALTNLTIPSGTWKADVDFSSCPLITYAEMQDIIGGLYTYTSGTHTITWNTTYWDSLTQAQQQTISDAASAKGWQTNAVMVVYAIKGTSTAVSETFVVSFIDDNLQITQETITCAVSGGNFQHQYPQNKKIYSLDNFVNSNTLTSIDFSESDGLTELTSASNAFSGCTSLSTISIGTFTWLVDIVLSDCPIASASMLAFLGNFADYSLGSQHIVRISPYSAADMGANADSIKNALSAKNWHMPLSQIGIHTRYELMVLVNNGYIPICSQSEYVNINANANYTMGADTEYEGEYYCGDAANYVVIKQFNMSWATTRNINAIFDGNMLQINAKNIDYGNTAFIGTIGADAAIRNVHYIGGIYPHNQCCSFVQTNNGTIEDCCIDLRHRLGASANQYGFLATNNGNVRNVFIRCVNVTWGYPDYWNVRRLFETNNGNVVNVCVIGTYNGPRGGANYNRATFVNRNTNAINNVIDNQLADQIAYGVVYNNTDGTIADCYRNTDRKLTLGAAIGKTSAELIADSIGSGIYANFSSSIWKKDNDGFPTLKIVDNVKINNDFTEMSAYDALYALVTILETQITAETITLSVTFWNGLTAEQQATIQGILQSKNYNLATA